MIAPGLYRHYKGNYYRVLFAPVIFTEGEHADVDGVEVAPLAPNDEVVVYVSDDHFLCACPASVFPVGKFLRLALAKWSGNGAHLAGDRVVIYVGLYGDGRVSARDLSEFEGAVDGSNKLRFARVSPSCHACAFSAMGPDDEYLVCGHPDAGSGGSYIRKEPLAHCPGYSKFEQHPLRNPDGSLKQGEVQAFASRHGSGR